MRPILIYFDIILNLPIFLFSYFSKQKHQNNLNNPKKITWIQIFQKKTWELIEDITLISICIKVVGIEFHLLLMSINLYLSKNISFIKRLKNFN